MSKIPGAVRTRLADPGTLYNLGNVLGFAAGLAVALSANAPGESAALWDRAMGHVIGSPAALALTAATVVFFWGGIVYGRAWTGGVLANPALNRQGDVLSGAGAIILGIGLVMIGDPWLAASAGAMHAIGKFGSALGGGALSRRPVLAERVATHCKDLVLFSRVPATLAGTIALWQQLTQLDNMPDLVLASSFVACCIIWAVADWMLLSPRGWIRRTTASLAGTRRPG